ncbi:PilC/PilY family type IV pilus protein [Acinetobacter indicus]|uniref:PilC/PilY family type IV pilus protein n=1 Tax=Acinetobacter indicus TaxID=756892 RepID=UPI00209028D6|nr:PilC/PilY family type IV pilus protein [Acinetobacter indicus]
MQLKKIQMSVLSASLTALMCSGVVQASDLQIYAMPTAGQKTLVMMVDVSGSMAYKMGSDSTAGYNEKSRLSELKNGLKAVINSTDSKLENVVIGLGKYPGNGSSRSSSADRMRGKILVEAKKLGPSTKTNGVFDSQHRRDLLSAVNDLTAVGGTPTAHGLTEAASYLMGTRTDSYALERDVLVYDQLYRTEVTQTQKEECHDWRTGYGGYSGYCDNGSNDVRESGSPADGVETTKKCGNLAGTWITANGRNYYSCASSWSNTSETFSKDQYTEDFTAWSPPGAWSSRNNANGRRERTKTRTKTTNYYVNGRDIVVKDTYNTSDYAGIADSTGTMITDGITHYKSPLPAVAKRVSCDGQGVYILSDGKPNASSESAAETQMKNALANPLGQRSAPTFTCASGTFTNALSGGDSTGAWQCMGEFAKRLYSGANPAGVKIQTAFVGYSNSFNNLSNDDVRNACKLGSNLKGDDCSYYQADGLTLNPNATRRNPESGYGNGGFYTANSANDVTQSVLNFIDNLGTDPLSPLPTGALSVPIDALNPNGLQNVGYLRMLEPNPAQPSLLTWAGNLKKYTMKDGVLVDRNINIFDAIGNFATNTKNLWGSLSQNDGGLIHVGGTYEMLPMPTETKQSTLRNLVTDVKDVNNDILIPLETRNASTGTITPTPLLRVPDLDTGISKNAVLNQFRSQSVLSQFPVSVRLKLLNYLGFKVDTALEELPENDEVSYEGSPYISMGGIIHSFPVQMTYSGVISSSGELLTQDIPLDDGNFVRARQQSVLYGSMEGGLHIVDSLTGEEQMVFVPAEILNNEIASNALVQKGSGTPAPAHGVDAPWVVDATYRTSGTHPNAQVVATKMNVYGGLRMGGNSFYALDVLNPKKPKLKFRIGPDLSDFSRMGQSWSKPTLINLRINGKPKRAMVVGGGYDMCYENPRFTLASAATENDTDNCSTKTRAKGNAIYVVDADTGERLFWASNNDSDADNTHMKHSIVSRVSALDRDGDGFEDHLYFGDLGGQIFRIDLDNYHEKEGESFGVRTTRLANLATNTDGTSITNGDNPRFYEPVTLTIHDEQGSTSSKTFIVVGAASGDRSTPLDVAPTEGRDGLSPNIALSGRPVNKVYGIFDLDFINDSLITNRELTTDYTATTSEEDVPLSNRLLTRELTLKDLLSNPQVALTETNTAYSQYFNETAPKFGWYRSLSWSWDTTANGAELANGTFRKPGGLKAFEEPLAIGNNLFIPVYDPEGTGITPQDPCLPRVVGETDRQQYCLPFGVCVTDTGAIDIMREKKTGFRVERDDAGWKNANVIGKGIQGIALANNGGTTGNNSCGNFTLASNTSGIGNWQCTRKLNPTRWFEKR